MAMHPCGVIISDATLLDRLPVPDSRDFHDRAGYRCQRGCGPERGPEGRVGRGTLAAPARRYLLMAKRIRACSSPCLIFPVSLITWSFQPAPSLIALATTQPLSLVTRLGQMSATC